MINDSLPRLSAFEVAKRLRRYNEDHNYAHLGDCHSWDAVSFMYPDVTVTAPDDRTTVLNRMFGPLDETEEQFNERQRSEPRITITVLGSAAHGKSAVAELIRQKLEEVGVLACLTDDNGIGIIEEQPGVIADSLPQRLESMVAKNAMVTIKTQLVHREHS